MRFIQLQGKEDGFVMVTCMMIMVVLTLVGIMALSTTDIELRIAGNDKVAKTAFYRADSGIFTAPKVVREAIDVGPTLDISTMNLDGGGLQSEFYRKMMGFDTTAGNIAFQQGDGSISANIFRSGTEQLPGESVEFASGYGGGPTSSQGTGILYTINSTGDAPDNAISTIEALYLFIPGRPGGL